MMRRLLGRRNQRNRWLLRAAGAFRRRVRQHMPSLPPPPPPPRPTLAAAVSRQRLGLRLRAPHGSFAKEWGCGPAMPKAMARTGSGKQPLSYRHAEQSTRHRSQLMPQGLVATQEAPATATQP
jgi:hypothetical protein